MWEILTIFTRLETIITILWTSFTAYALWYFTYAKHYAPITFNDARILWKIHRQNSKCNSSRWRVIRRKEKTIGFECECGYRHIQRRPIVSSTPTTRLQAGATQKSIHDKLHTSYR